MNNKQVISHYQISSDFDRKMRKDMCRLIGLQQARIEALEATNTDLIAQRDVWRTMAIELEQVPGRFEVTEPQKAKRTMNVGLIYECADCGMHVWCGNGWVAPDGTIVCKDCN